VRRSSTNAGGRIANTDAELGLHLGLGALLTSAAHAKRKLTAGLSSVLSGFLVALPRNASMTARSLLSLSLHATPTLALSESPTPRAVLPTAKPRITAAMTGESAPTERSLAPKLACYVFKANLTLNASISSIEPLTRKQAAAD